MPKTYAQLRNEMEALWRRMEAARRKEGAGALKEIRKLVSLYGFTAEDVFGDAPKVGIARKSSSQAPKQEGPKYQDGQGNSWSGRGPRPAWLRAALESGEALESFMAAPSRTKGTEAIAQAPATKRGTGTRAVAAKKRRAKTVTVATRRSAVTSNVGDESAKRGGKGAASKSKPRKLAAAKRRPRKAAPPPATADNSVAATVS